RRDFTTPMVPGAACATMYTDGPFWAGGIGTATYVDGDVVLAYGHPMDWSGRSGLYFDNAWIDGIWGSSAAAFKLGSPGKVRGTMTQDRNAAVGARLDVTPVGVPVTSTATVAVDGTRTVTETSHLAPFAVQLPQLGPDLAAAAASTAVYKAADAWAQPGSAETTARIKVSDGTTTYTVTRDNLWYDSSDVSWTTAQDVWTILWTLLADPDGVAPARVVSVDLASRIVATPNTATIIGVSLPEGLKEGANRVVVRIRPYGSMTALDVPVTLTLPAGTPVQGWLTVSPGYEPVEGGEPPGGGLPSSDSPKRLAQVVEELNELPTNADLKVTFTPGSEDASAITATARTDHVVRGSVGFPVSSILLQLRPTTVGYRGTAMLHGMMSGVSTATTVELWSRAVGRSHWRLVDDRIPVEPDPEMGGGRFSYPLRGFRNTTDLRVVWAGDSRALGSFTEITLAVKARISLRSRTRGRKVRLSTTVTPAQAGARVRFEVRRRSGWKQLRTLRLSAKSTATWTWKAPSGTHKVRARFLGSPSNAAAATKVRTIVVP
ncbi:MAG: hypothetical protein FJ000_01770, partial [Actinobacteria bacterium]|nr:hypothetical protein [Actinomycetota bacterium]